MSAHTGKAGLQSPAFSFPRHFFLPRSGLARRSVFAKLAAVIHLRTCLLPLLAATLALCLNAAESSPPPEPAKASPAPAPVGPVIELPPIKVQEKRVKEIDAELKKLDKLIAREKKNLKATDLDKSLNSDKVSNALAIFGGNSASHMVAVAATRVALLEQERALLERLKFPRTEADQAMVEKELDNIRTTRRDLDDAAKQR